MLVGRGRGISGDVDCGAGGSHLKEYSICQPPHDLILVNLLMSRL